MDTTKEMMEQRLTDDRTNISSLKLKRFDRRACGCLPGCFGISYTQRLTSSELVEKLDIRKDYLAGRSAKYFRKNMAVLHVFVKETQFTAKQRGELFGFTEFLSSVGGILGLFMGFSFLSAVEALYFLTLRIWCSVQRKEHRETVHPRIITVAPYPFVHQQPEGHLHIMFLD